MRSLLLLCFTFLCCSTAQAAEDALDELNAARAGRGLAPYERDDNLTQAAKAAADFRASGLVAGHTSNDFAFLSAGSSASAAGCAAWHPSLGWGACCSYEGWSRAGAAWSMGSDGRRYMHLFVAGDSSGVTSGSSTGGDTSVDTDWGRRRYRRR
jgi:hypothetical protein